MKRVLVAFLALLCLPALLPADTRPVAPNGIALFEDYQTWHVIAA